MVGQSEGYYQREGTVGGENVGPCYMEAYVIVHRPHIKSGNKMKRKTSYVYELPITVTELKLTGEFSTTVTL